MLTLVRRIAVVSIVALVCVSAAFADDHAAKNKEIVAAFVEQVCNDNRLDLIGEYFTEDYIEHNLMPGAPGGIEGLRGMLGQMETAFPGVEHRVIDMVASGDYVGIRATMAGTNTGPLFDMPPTGKKVSVEMIGIVRIEDGKIVEHWGNSNDASMLRQLGVMPDDGMTPVAKEASADRMKRDESVSNDDAIAVAKQWMDIINSNKFSLIDEIIADGYQDHGPAMPSANVDEIKAFMKMLKAAFPDMKTTIEATVAEGGMVATHWSATMTHAGDFMGMPATGKKLRITGTMFDRVSGGQIHDHWEVVDEMAMAQQMGMIPGPDGGMDH